MLDCLSAQTLDPNRFEVLVCDDGSHENLSPVVNEFGKRLPNLLLLRQDNRGPAAARNLGVAHSRSDVVVFVDSDVAFGAELLERLVGKLREQPAWMGAETRLLPSGGQASTDWDAPASRGGGHYHTAAIAYRRTALDKIGGFDENFTRAACEDVELAVQVLRLGPIGFVADAVVFHPRRRRTIASCWETRRNWRFIVILALRHGFVAWPGRRTKFPRLRTALCAIASLPLGKSLSALRCADGSPGAALRGLLFALIECVGGVSMLPVIFTVALPERRSRFNEMSMNESGIS